VNAARIKSKLLVVERFCVQRNVKRYYRVVMSVEDNVTKVNAMIRKHSMVAPKHAIKLEQPVDIFVTTDVIPTGNAQKHLVELKFQ
jgi:hypothetical protein